MEQECVINVEHVRKQFKVYADKGTMLKERVLSASRSQYEPLFRADAGNTFSETRHPQQQESHQSAKYPLFGSFLCSLSEVSRDKENHEILIEDDDPRTESEKIRSETLPHRQYKYFGIIHLCTAADQTSRKKEYMQVLSRGRHMFVRCVLGKRSYPVFDRI